jgi:hypothetical protein
MKTEFWIVLEGFGGFFVKPSEADKPFAFNPLRVDIRMVLDSWRVGPATFENQKGVFP